MKKLSSNTLDVASPKYSNEVVIVMGNLDFIISFRCVNENDKKYILCDCTNKEYLLLKALGSKVKPKSRVSLDNYVKELRKCFKLNGKKFLKVYGMRTSVA